MGLDFYVEEGVLIPRPDTEVLVEHIIEHVKSRSIKAPRIIDLGTGSGAIAISLAKYGGFPGDGGGYRQLCPWGSQEKRPCPWAGG